MCLSTSNPSSASPFLRGIGYPSSEPYNPLCLFLVGLLSSCDYREVLLITLLTKLFLPVEGVFRGGPLPKTGLS